MVSWHHVTQYLSHRSFFLLVVLTAQCHSDTDTVTSESKDVTEPPTNTQESNQVKCMVCLDHIAKWECYDKHVEATCDGSCFFLRDYGLDMHAKGCLPAKDKDNVKDGKYNFTDVTLPWIKEGQRQYLSGDITLCETEWCNTAARYTFVAKLLLAAIIFPLSLGIWLPGL